MIFGSVRNWKIKKNTKRCPMPLKLCRLHIDIILSLPTKNQVKIPSVAWRTQLVPPRKNHVSSCPAQKSSEISIGGVLLSAPPTPWSGWPPRPSRAHGACEGRGEGRSQGGTADGHPPSGVAPAAVTGPPAPAGGSGGGGGGDGDGDRDDGDGGDDDDDDGDDGAGEIAGAGSGDGGGAGETHGGYFSKPNCPVTTVEGHPSQDGRLEGPWGETLISPDGLGGGGHKVPRTRGYLSKPDSPEKAIRPGGRQA